MEQVGLDRALQAVHRVTSEIEPSDDLQPEFVGRLSAAVAELVSARRAGFFLLEGESLRLLQRPFGIDQDLAGGVTGLPCRPGGRGVAERIVLNGESFRTGHEMAGEQMGPSRKWLGALGSWDAVAVPWAAGKRRLGLVAALDSTRDGGFSKEDLSVLEAAAATAALVWQQRELSGQLLSARSEETARMRPLAKRMRELEEMKGHILNLAAHELRGPIAVIRGYLSMVADSSLDTDGLRRILPILLGKIAQMDNQVTQMLDAARLEEGRMELATKDVDLGAIVREVVEVAGLLTPPGISILLERAPEPVIIEADAARVATIAGNLIDNAVKYSPAGGLIKCTVGTSNGSAVVRVEDNGLGIAPEDMNRLFSRFGRILTPENSHIGGTGLGLHLSQQLARLHGGDLQAESEAGRGSIFTLSLPLRQESGTPT